MKVYYNLDDLVVKSPTVCGLGNFDGVHLGHQRLIHELVTIANKNNLESFVVTFEPHPSKILCPEKSPPLITTLCQKKKLMEGYGVKNLAVIPFTYEFSQMSYEEFINRILIEKLKVKRIVVGYNFRFGRGGQGTAEKLKILGMQKGFKTSVIQPVTINGKIVSSTLIRYLIEKGDMKEAEVLLGRPFSIHGIVVEGEAIGRKLGFPTANVSFSPEIIKPAFGVYAVLISRKGKIYRGIANIGQKPTFKKNNKDNQIMLEVHIFDFNQQIYGEEIEVYFIERIREEKLFKDVESLVHQVKEDLIKARYILDKIQNQNNPYLMHDACNQLLSML
ncbi:MAG: bifunctional riboflavin kinase/FAD synthetase [Thermosediminibacteraceae bacterium]|nr:bifunctional riboflavin kinase/FAD synthetase [Thermosediminibacteraceae bacterium]